MTFRTRGNASTTVTPVEFLRRLVDHVLPPSFVKIRHYGLLAGAKVDGKLERARRLLTPDVLPWPRPLKPRPWFEDLAALALRDVRRCLLCGGEIIFRALPPSRAPPISP